MGYYCTVPQCTSLAGKTKNVKFHRFPRDVAMADKWNVILKRGKPYTKYSKVCSLHFTQQDYNVTTMGQWKTLSKDAVPSQNLPRCNPDGTPMVIRKSRTVKCKQTHIKKEMDLACDKTEDKWPHTSAAILHGMANAINDTAAAALHSSAIHETALVYNRIQQSLTNLAQQHSQHQSTSSSSTSSLNNSADRGIQKTDATQQTEPRSDVEEYDPIEPFSGQGTSNQFQKGTPSYNRRDYEVPKDYTQKNTEEFMKTPDYHKSTDFSKTSNEYPSKSSSEYEKSSASPDFGKGAPDFGKGAQDFGKGAQDFGKGAQDFGKNDDFLPQTNEEYNKEAEKYALERKSHFDKLDSGYHKTFPTYPKLQDVYPEYNREYSHNAEKADYPRYHDYQNGFPEAGGHNLALLHEQHRLGENPGFFGEPHIKQEIDLSGDDDKYLYERSKEALEASSMYEQQRLMQQRLLDHVKTEPDATAGCEGVMQAQSSPYYQNGHNNIPGGYYQQYARQPLGPELLIAKQNALAAHTQLWQNTMKRPFFYSESPHYNGSPILQRYEDLTRISQ